MGSKSKGAKEHGIRRAAGWVVSAVEVGRHLYLANSKSAFETNDIHGGHVTCYTVDLGCCGAWRKPGNSEQ
jgi:hypothetical protein